MKRSTQNMLYHLLPVVFWLLAVGGSCVPVIIGLTGEAGLTSNSDSGLTSYYYGYLVAVLVMTCIGIIGRIKRHTNSVEECFLVALLLGIASYWLPTVLFLIIPVWGYLIYRNLFSFRSFLATLIGVATVAIWVLVLNYFSIFNFQFSLAYNLWAWIPVGSVLTAWLASTIARQILRVR